MVLSLFTDGVQIETKGTSCKLAPARVQMLKDFKADPTTFNKSTVTNFDNTFASVLDEGGDVTCAGCKFDVIA